MSRYHINDKGNVGKCSAKPGNCLFKNDDSTEQIHYSTKQEAQAAAEERLKAKIQVASLKKADPAPKPISSIKGSNVSTVSNMCEDAMADNADVEEIARKISIINDSQRVVALRKLDHNEIVKVLKDWRIELNDFVEKRVGTADFTINSGNIGGNSADSDFIITSSNGETIMNLEAKFGSATNGAIGIARASNLTDFPAFNFDKDEKNELLNLYSQKGETAVIRQLSEKMNKYSDEFNKEKREVSSQEIYDIVKSSGKSGNSKNVKDYSVVNFRQKEGKGQISETEITLKDDEKWNVKTVVNIQEDTARLAYLFETEDKQKQLKVLFNNKNSIYVKKNADGSLELVNKMTYEKPDELIKIQSKLQMGTGSYNVWYKEGLELEE